VSTAYLEQILWDEFRRDVADQGLTIHADAAALVRELIAGMAQHTFRGGDVALVNARNRVRRLSRRMGNYCSANNQTEIDAIVFHHSRPLTGRFKAFTEEES
jgi:predicted kinase